MGTFVNVVLIVAGLVAIFLMGGLPSLLIALVICVVICMFHVYRAEAEAIRQCREARERHERGGRS